MESTINQMPMPMPEPKNKTWLWVLIVIIVALLAGGGVYAWQNMNAEKQSQVAAEKVRNEMQQKITETENKLADLQTKLDEQQKTIDDLCRQADINVFNSDNIKVGDSVANMTILSVKTSYDTDAQLKNYEIQFSGQATLSGQIYESDMSTGREKEICFKVDSSDQGILPAEVGSPKTRVVLCFSNLAEAKKMLTQNTWTKIVIDNYKLKLIGYDLITTADLIKILP